MILNLLRVEELRVEDMMKRSFAELGKIACTISNQLFEFGPAILSNANPG
jgi:hypothetical protein